MVLKFTKSETVHKIFDWCISNGLKNMQYISSKSVCDALVSSGILVYMWFPICLIRTTGGESRLKASEKERDPNPRGVVNKNTSQHPPPKTPYLSLFSLNFPFLSCFLHPFHFNLIVFHSFWLSQYLTSISALCLSVTTTFDAIIAFHPSSTAIFDQ